MESSEKVWNRSYNHPLPWDSRFGPLSVPDMLIASEQAKPDAPAIDFMGRKYSYAETLNAARRVNKGLRRLGVERGDRVGLFLPNVPHYVAAYYGAMMMGATVVNFSPLYTLEELKHQVEDSGTRILFTLSAKALLPTALQVLEQSSVERLIVGSIAGVLSTGKSLVYRVLHADDAAVVPEDPRISRFSQLIDNDGDAEAAEIDPMTDVALIQYTGGTTGTPKGAVLTHQNLSANARQVASIDGHVGDNDRIIGALPLFHVFANTCVLNRTIAAAGEMVLLPRFNAEQVLKAIERTHAAYFPGVPTMFQALLDNPAVSQTDFSSLRVCISGGAPLPIELKQAFETSARSIVGSVLETELWMMTVCGPSWTPSLTAR